MKPRQLFSLLILMALILGMPPLTVARPLQGTQADPPPAVEHPVPVSRSPAKSAASAPPAIANPEAVLWNQPLSAVDWSAFANQDFTDLGGDPLDIYIADDFTNLDLWTIDTIFVPGNTWNDGCDLTCADMLHWQIYADVGGVPDGDPSGGGNPPVWSLSLPPGDGQIALSAGIDGWLSNVTLSLSSPAILPPGTWWLVFYPSLELVPCCQYGRQQADTTNGYTAQVINPGGGFGFPPVWTSVQDPGTWGLILQDMAFRLEGIAGQPGWLEGFVMDSETGDVDPTCTQAVVYIEPLGLEVLVDPATGYYGPVALPEGSYTVEATAPGYSLEVAMVDIVAGQTTLQDFNLWRPVVEVQPTDFISITAYISQETTYPLLIDNVGHLPTDFEIVELEPGALLNPLSGLQYEAGIEVEPELLAQWQARDASGYMIYLREHADLAPAFQMGWRERGWFVMNALQDTADRSQARVRAYLDARGVSYQAFWIDNVIVVESSDRATFDGLLDFPEIAALRAERVMQVIEPVSRNRLANAPEAIELNISHVNADQVWALGFQGEGMVVANIDTGVRYTHQALDPHYRGNLGGGVYDHDYNWLDPDSGNAIPFDDHGHGSHTMGTMVGDDGGANQIGMAPGAQWIACDGCNQFTGCPGASLLTCAQWVAAPYPIGDPGSPNPDMRPHVVNNSWGGCGLSYDNWYQASVDGWHAAGIYPVFSNGNASNCGYSEPPGCNTVGNPGRYGNVTGVGSTGQSDGAYAIHSNWGPTDNPDIVNPNGYPDLKPQVVAPGVNIRSSLNGSDSDYASWGGTSMSAPHVSALVALMWQACPALIGDYATTETMLQDTAVPIPYASDCGSEGPGNVPNHATGWGEIDALAAVQAASDYCLQADLPWVWTDPISGTIAGPGQIEIDVTFHCTETRDYVGSLLVLHDDPCQEPIEVPIVLHCLDEPPSVWSKVVNGVEWYPDMFVTLEMSDTLEVVEVVTTEMDFVLVEFWNPDELRLITAIPSIGEVIVTPGYPTMLEWIVPPGMLEPAMLIKEFHVEPCVWQETILLEELWIGGVEFERRPVRVIKIPPLLWIDAEYEPEVWAGGPADFTLVYGNDGGRENDVLVRNDFPPEAPYLGSDPPADRSAADGSWAEWDVPELGMDEGGRITVTVGIDATLPPSTTIEIWDYIFDHTGLEQGAVLIELHVRWPEWYKEVNGEPWYPDMAVTLEMSDTLEVVDVVTTLQDFVLFETWNPDELDLVDYQVEPPGVSMVVTDTPGMLEWFVPPGEPMVVTLTKWFHVEPCRWEQTVLWEELWVAGAEYEQRPVTVIKIPPLLWIDAEYEPEVWAGGPADFALVYGNDGGRENDVLVRNDFPPEAPYLGSDPPADRWAADGSWAEWDVPELGMDEGGRITVTVDIDATLPPSTTIEIWDYIFDHTGLEQGAVLIELHVRWPEWYKEVNGEPWYPDMIFTLEMSDTLEVVDVVTTLQDFVLLETWNPDELALVDYQVEPPGVSMVITDTPGVLEWLVPPGEPMVVTLTKWFHVEPCTWEETVLWEELWVAGVEIEQRPVTVIKIPPLLWIDAEYEPEVWAGEAADFTLVYGNDGGRENDVMVRNDFPDEAPYLDSDPPADRSAPDGSWAEWDVPELGMDEGGRITVTVDIDATLPPSTTIEIWDYIFDHTGVEQGAVLIELHVREIEWYKEVNGEPWYPGITLTLETSDTMEVVDVVMTTQDFELVESWDPGELDLMDYQVEPPGVSTVVTDTPGVLQWLVPPGEPLVVTLTKWFHVEPCTWTETVLWEELWLAGAEYEQRPVTVTKVLPDLWIDAGYESEVLPGAEVTFTLLYGNDGGYETGVMVRNDFPDEAPFVTSEPAADRWAADGSWAEWDVGDLALDAEGQIVVTISVLDTLEVSDTFEVTDVIVNHAGEEMDDITLTFTVKAPGFYIYLPIVVRDF